MFLRLHTFQYEPWIVESTAGNGTKIFSGALPSLIAHLASILNFSYQYFNATGLSIGNYTDGNWTGLLGMLFRNETDVILLPFLITSTRFESFKFMAEISYNMPVILSGKPTTYRSLKSAISVLVLTPNAMVCLAALLLLVSIVTFWGESSSPLWRLKRKRKLKEFPAVASFFWFYFSSLFTQSTTYRLARTPSRLVNATWWLSLVVLFGMFNGSMRLTFTVVNNFRLENLEEIVARPKVRPIVNKESGYADYFRHAVDPVVAATWRQVERLQGDLTTKEIEERALDISGGGSVLIAGEDDVIGFMQGWCRPLNLRDAFYWAKGVPLLELIAIPVNPGLQRDFYERVNRVFRQYAATMQANQVVRRARSLLDECMVKKQQEAQRPFSVGDFCTVFTLWTMGMIGAVLLLFLELLTSKKFIH